MAAPPQPPQAAHSAQRLATDQRVPHVTVAEHESRLVFLAARSASDRPSRFDEPTLATAARYEATEHHAAAARRMHPTAIQPPESPVINARLCPSDRRDQMRDRLSVAATFERRRLAAMPATTPTQPNTNWAGSITSRSSSVSGPKDDPDGRRRESSEKQHTR